MRKYFHTIMASVIMAVMVAVLLAQPVIAQAQPDEVVNPADIAALAVGMNVLINFDNLPSPVDGRPIPAGYAGCTWNSFVEGSPWAGNTGSCFIVVINPIFSPITAAGHQHKASSAQRVKGMGHLESFYLTVP